MALRAIRGDRSFRVSSFAARSRALRRLSRSRKTRVARIAAAASKRLKADDSSRSRQWIWPFRRIWTRVEACQSSTGRRMASRSAETAGTFARRREPPRSVGRFQARSVSRIRSASSSSRGTRTRISSGWTPRSSCARTSRATSIPSPSPRGPPRIFRPLSFLSLSFGRSWASDRKSSRSTASRPLGR